MRDPESTLHFSADAITRVLNRAISHYPFLLSPLSTSWQSQRSMVSYSVTGDQQITAERVPFVSQPPEWCDAQFHDASSLTLTLLREAVEAGFDLKDASAWNIIFSGTRPQLCDHTSIIELTGRRWWAAGQFSRHFLLPLLLSKRRGLRAGRALGLWQDGVPPETARRLLGPMRFLTRYWPLTAEGARPEAPNAPVAPVSPTSTLRECQTFRRRLHVSLEWMNSGLEPQQSAATIGTRWRDYTENRDHYAPPSIRRKQEQVRAWLDMIRPGWVADLGCNTGEFSRMSLATGANVVAIDADHDAIQSLYLQNPSESRLFPMLLDLDNLSGGSGWMGDEHTGATGRLWQRFDLVLMLGLVHHLLISLAIPVAQVARLARALTRDWIIVEWISSEDAQMKLLCKQRDRHPADFDISEQRKAFLDAGFHFEATLDLAPTHRHLALMRCV